MLGLVKTVVLSTVCMEALENTNATCIYLSSSRIDSFEEIFRGCFDDLGVIDDAGSFDGVLVGFSVKNTTSSREDYSVTA